jgi:hypothetical protein
MSGDLDDVVAGVGRRRGEPGDHHLIDRGTARGHPRIVERRRQATDRGDARRE